MNVKELRAILAKMSPKAEVFVAVDSLSTLPVTGAVQDEPLTKLERDLGGERSVYITVEEE